MISKGSKRAYPHKAEDERRIVVSFSLSGPMLKSLRERLEQYMHSQPTKNEVQAFARGKAYEAIEDYLAHKDVPEDERDELSPLTEDEQRMYDAHIIP